MSAETKIFIRPLSRIASEIIAKWPSMYFGAKPYAIAMLHIDSVHDTYDRDSGREIVLRFLCNASSWRGEDARRIKKELNAILKGEGQ